MSLFFFFKVERGADGMTVMYWYHRQFIQAAMDRYCENAKILHEALADFFSGKWSNGRSCLVALLVFIHSENSFELIINQMSRKNTITKNTLL